MMDKEKIESLERHLDTTLSFCRALLDARNDAWRALAIARAGNAVRAERKPKEAGR